MSVDHASTDDELRTERRLQDLVPALLKWIGNKQRFAETIISYMPAQFNSYYEPFLGSGAVMAALLQADSTMMFPHFDTAHGSDILPFLIDVFSEVKTAPDGLIEYYGAAIEEYYKNPKEQYEMIRQRFNTDHNSRDFVLLSRTCYSGIIRFRKADDYMSTPVGPHRPISPETFRKRVMQWHNLLQKASFETVSFEKAMDRPQDGDVVYCDPPYTHSQSIIYGAQDFDINVLWQKIAECKARGVKVLLSINGMRESKKKDISVVIPDGIFERKIIVDCGTSMIDRLQNTGKTMDGEKVDDLLLLTW